MFRTFKYLEEDSKFYIIAAIVCTVIVAGAITSLYHGQISGGFADSRAYAQVTSQNR